jgi:uncharacterized CHY-type Zn-finger protein
MFLSCRKKQRGFALIPLLKNTILFSILNHILYRKVILSPQFKQKKLHQVRAFFFAPLRGALTVEASLVLPIFLFCMIAALQYCQVMETSVKLAASLCETGKEMATAAYLYEYPEDGEHAPGTITTVLSDIWAQNQVLKAAGDTSCIKNANMALSSFLKENEMIDLVLTYQIKSPIQIVKLPGNFFLQRASVRAWTGRLAADENDSENGSGERKTVYVTETGSVYHENLECTYLKLSIREVDSDELGALRNRSGEKYYACEHCGDGTMGSSVYITNEGNRYHNSLSCSGLKRTVTEIIRADAKNMKPCSKCGH